MIDFDDSHEWAMWRAKEDLNTGSKVMCAVPNTPVASSVVKVDAKAISVQPLLRPTPKPKMTRDEYNELRRDRKGKGKNSWAVRMQKRLNAWLKGGSDEDLERTLGYSRAQLQKHLERQFRNGMSWHNYAGNKPFKAKKTWVIDHIVPKRLFRESEASNAFHLTNLRPLWIDDNLRKNLKRDRLI